MTFCSTTWVTIITLGAFSIYITLLYFIYVDTATFAGGQEDYVVTRGISVVFAIVGVLFYLRAVLFLIAKLFESWSKSLGYLYLMSFGAALFCGNLVVIGISFGGSLLFLSISCCIEEPHQQHYVRPNKPIVIAMMEMTQIVVRGNATETQLVSPSVTTTN